MSIIKTTLAILSAVGLFLFLFLWQTAASGLEEAETLNKRLETVVAEAERRDKALQEELDVANGSLKLATSSLSEAQQNETKLSAEIARLRQAGSEAAQNLEEAEERARALEIKLLEIEAETAADKDVCAAAPAPAPAANDAAPSGQAEAAQKTSAGGAAAPAGESDNSPEDESAAAPAPPDHPADKQAIMDQLGLMAANLKMVSKERDELQIKLRQAQSELARLQADQAAQADPAGQAAGPPARPLKD
ncbi:MAG: hypothetical protein LBP95_11390 [Deltaproteobacteria bacterium]|jgi:hypothetical protein|nr:hypothetical protein [Deltaproteobacteria bacterium]